MKKLLFLFTLLLSLGSSAQWPDEEQHVAGEFIVMLQPGVEIKELLRQMPQLHPERMISRTMNIWLVKGDMAQEEELLNQLKRSGFVKLAQYNHRVQQRSVIPNDPNFNLQWNMRNTGQLNGTPGADIRATDAWGLSSRNITAHGDTVVVAVIDGTYDIDHNDLNFFRNYQEIPDNGIDDDANGFIDDYEGWNAFDQSGKINKGGTDPHAMHVAGITGARGNDSVGIAGTCWGVKILRIAGSSTTEADVVASYDYAITMRNLYNQTFGTKGAFIVATNSSFGVDNGNPVDFPIWCALYDTMGALGILSSTATANRPLDVDVMHDIPTECPSKWMIAVTNTTMIDRLNAGAAYGKNSIDLGAPGTSIYSTYASNGYGYRTGTSMASPHIAGGVAAMLAAACPELLNDYAAYPDSVAYIIKQMMLDGTDRISDLYNKTLTGGRLNLYHALRNLDEYNCDRCDFTIEKNIQQPSCSNSCDGAISLSVTDTGTYEYNWGNGFGNMNQMQDLCPGFYSVTVKDASGCLQTRNVSLFRPDSIVIAAISTVPASGSNPGNIIVGANAGNYRLEYSLNGINFQQSATLPINHNGNYTVFVRSESGCVVQREVLVSSVESSVNLNDWNIYPNPTGSILNISFAVAQSKDVNISVINALGETLLQQPLNIPAGGNTYPLFVQNFPSGLYVLQIKSHEGTASRIFMVRKL